MQADLVVYGSGDGIEVEVTPLDELTRHHSLFITSGEITARYFMTTPQLIALAEQIALAIPPVPITEDADRKI